MKGKCQFLVNVYKYWLTTYRTNFAQEKCGKVWLTHMTLIVLTGPWKHQNKPKFYLIL